MKRIQKRISELGYCSRRKAEELIILGRVKVNDQLLNQSNLGFLVNDDDIIKIDDKIINQEIEKIYLVLNKPSGYIVSTDDEFNRKTIYQLLDTKYQKMNLSSLGRLDYDTKGVIILTNDGEFKNQCSGPKSGIEKEYLARVKGIVTKPEITVLLKGLNYQGVQYLPAVIKIISIDKEHDSTLLSIIITDGKNHEIKNMFEYINHPIKKLNRIRYGNITLANLPIGKYRHLTIHETHILYNLSKQNKNLRER